MPATTFNWPVRPFPMPTAEAVHHVLRTTPLTHETQGLNEPYVAPWYALACSAVINKIDAEFAFDPTGVAEETSNLRHSAIDKLFGQYPNSRMSRDYLTVFGWPCAPFPVLVHTTFHHFDLFLEMYTTITMNDPALCEGEPDAPGRHPRCGDWRSLDQHAIGSPVTGLLPSMDLKGALRSLGVFLEDDVAFMRIVLASLE